MKCFFTFIFIILTSFFVYSQKITQEQEKIIFDIAKKSAYELSDKVIYVSEYFHSDTDKINIELLPVKNSAEKNTLFGTYFSKFLSDLLQNRLNNAIIKDYNYNIFFDQKVYSDSLKFDFVLEISYFFTDTAIFFSAINLHSKNFFYSYSLKTFSINKDLTIIRNLDKNINNFFYDKIINLNGGKVFLDSIIFKNNKNKNIIPKNSELNLNLNEKYTLRLYFKPFTYVYLLYYEPQKSFFSVFYPQIPAKNRKTTYKIKDFRDIYFKNTEYGILEIIISEKKLKINSLLSNSDIGLSAKDAEFFYEVLTDNIEYISSNVIEIYFNR